MANYFITFYNIFCGHNILRSIFKSSLKIAGQKSNKYLSLLVKNINESMEGIKELKIFNKENFFLIKLNLIQKNMQK